ncbi:hypothetical protein [Cellulosilyticum sp. WCF-2]|uniref:hypothetical protein n=1 Tax=Cellulosilyticum sp. WCF-2 TaxID=2497860 RepID=UPI000F8E4C12|nr:hypothetical protein [Cellulosilyticum sp. WCF-2]QEH69732.1 hypothetical protein EKH84_15555 [Cellulosilyticum sp. WCF-2]
MKKNRKNDDYVYHNTVALLKEYRTLKEHCAECESSMEQVEMTQEAWEASVNGQDKKYEDYIKSAKRTKVRTRIMLQLIDRFMSAYKKKAESSNDPNAIFRYKVIDMRYISSKSTFKKISMELNCDPTTVSRWHQRAIDELAVYFFGIEGVKLEKLR